VENVADICSLLGRYCWLVDHGEWDEWQLCFAEDGAFIVRGNNLVGRQAIVDYVQEELSRFRMIRHLGHLPRVELDADQTSATCWSYFELRAVTHRGRETVALGSYVDRVTLGAQGWQIAERRADFDYWVPRQERWYGEDPAQSPG
jgi:3-phenylpropionate/cinnamic acid dioxygenase small subunit